MKATKKMIALLGAMVMAFAAKAAAPTVVIDSVTPAYPYGTAVETKYTVTAGDSGYSLKFYATVNNEVFDVTDTVTGVDEADRLTAGQHTVTWTAPANKLDTNAGLALKVVETAGSADPETVAELKEYSDDTFATKTQLNDYLTTATAASTYLTTSSASTTYQAKGSYLTTETDPSVSAWAKAATKPSYTFAEIATKPTTISGYGITDAKIANGTITLGSASITPLTTHQSLSAYSTTTDMNAAIDAAVSGLAAANTSTTYSGQPYMVVDLTTGAVTYESNAPEYYNAPIYKTTKMAFRRVPAGSYSCTTGAVYTANALSTNTAPDGVMTMAKDYYIAIFECTEAQYNAIMGSGATTSMLPKGTISWNAIRDSAAPTAAVSSSGSGVVAKLNKKTNLYFDLPTEAMWQVAAHAEGHPGAMWCYGNDESRLNIYGNVRSGTTAAALLNVGSRQPNQWGIYDMYGNVWEWCRDACPTMTWNANNSTVGAGTQTMSQTAEATGDNRVVRGGGCYSDLAAGWSRSGSRSRYPTPSYSGWDGGFRLSRIVQ